MLGFIKKLFGSGQKAVDQATELGHKGLDTTKDMAQAGAKMVDDSAKATADMMEKSGEAALKAGESVMDATNELGNQALETTKEMVSTSVETGAQMVDQAADAVEAVVSATNEAVQQTGEASADMAKAAASALEGAAAGVVAGATGVVAQATTMVTGDIPTPPEPAVFLDRDEFVLPRSENVDQAMAHIKGQTGDSGLATGLRIFEYAVAGASAFNLRVDRELLAIASLFSQTGENAGEQAYAFCIKHGMWDALAEKVKEAVEGRASGLQADDIETRALALGVLAEGHGGAVPYVHSVTAAETTRYHV